MSSSYGSRFRRARAPESGTCWTHEDIDRINEAVRTGMDIQQIHAMFPGRSKSSVVQKVVEARELLEVKLSIESDECVPNSAYWTAEEDMLLDDAILQGKTLPEIQSIFPQRSEAALRTRIKRRTDLLNDPSQQTTSQAPPQGPPQPPPFNPWLASGDEFAGYNRVNTGYGGVAPNANQHPDLVNGLDFTPTPNRPGDSPNFVTTKQMFWGKK